MIRSFSARLADPWVGRNAGDRAVSRARETAERRRCACDGRVEPCQKCRGGRTTKREQPGFDLATLTLAPETAFRDRAAWRLFLPFLPEHERPDEDEHHAAVRMRARVQAAVTSAAVEPLSRAHSDVGPLAVADLHDLVALLFRPEGAELAIALGEDLAHEHGPRLRHAALAGEELLAHEVGALLAPALVDMLAALAMPHPGQRSHRLPRFARRAAHLPLVGRLREATKARRTTLRLAADQLTTQSATEVDQIEVQRTAVSALADWPRALHAAHDLLVPGGTLLLELVGVPRDVDTIIDLLRRAGFTLQVQRDEAVTTLRATR